MFGFRPVGEALLLGEPTGRLTTGVRGCWLFDGSDLALAESAMTNRTGATRPARVEPDEPVDTDRAAFATGADPMLVAALEWLEGRSARSERRRNRRRR